MESLPETKLNPIQKIMGHPLFSQFFKYGICGILSTIVFFGCVFVFTRFFADFVSLDLPEGKRALHLNILHACAFLPANIVAYLTNRAFVFTPGKHAQHHEFMIFTGLAFLSFLVGLVFPEFIIRTFNAPNWVATFGFVVTSAMANFIGRKLFVFKN